MKITHDFHIHTNLSVCAKREATLEGYVAAGYELGLTKMGFANHFWDERVPYSCNFEGQGFYKAQGFDHVASIKSSIREYSTPELKLYFGCEVEFAHAIHAPALTPKIAEQFDYIIIPNSHTHIAMPAELYEPYSTHAEYMVEAYESIISSPIKSYLTAIAHPFEAVCCPYPRYELLRLIDDDTYKRIFSRTAEAGIAVEMNQECLKEAMKEEAELEERLRMIGIAKASGCKFLFGSDAHSHLHLKMLQNTDELIRTFSITEDDIADIAK